MSYHRVMNMNMAAPEPHKPSPRYSEQIWDPPATPYLQPPITSSTPSRRFSITDSWLLEFLSILATVACVAALAGILISMHDKPLSSWKGSISLSATISILTVVIRMFLLVPVSSCISQLKWTHFNKPQRMNDLDIFDNASRGPAGSVRFLFGRKTVTSLASLGAVITILSLILGPFFQQLVSLPLRPARDKVAASFGYTDVYDNGASVNGGSLIKSENQDTPMQAAILNALYGSNPAMDFTCASSNCTWQGEYVTFGFESTCQNVTTLASRKCNVDDSTDKSQSCIITTPGHVNIGTEFSPTDANTLSNISTSDIDLKSDSCSWPDCIPKDGPRLITFAIYRIYGLHPDSFYSLPESWWEVMECNISAVAHKSTNVKVQNNQLSIERNQTTPLIIKGILSQPFMELVTEDNAHSFKVNYYDFLQLRTFLKTRVFTGSVSVGFGSPLSGRLGVGSAALLHADVSEIAHNIALSMTNRIRQSRNATTAAGVSLRDVPYVSVQWWFFIVPLAIVLATAAFLVATVFSSRRRHEALWKSSNVALISHQMLGWSGLQTGARSQGQLERAVEDVKLELRGGEPLQFVVSHAKDGGRGPGG